MYHNRPCQLNKKTLNLFKPLNPAGNISLALSHLYSPTIPQAHQGDTTLTRGGAPAVGEGGILLPPTASPPNSPTS